MYLLSYYVFTFITLFMLGKIFLLFCCLLNFKTIRVLNRMDPDLGRVLLIGTI